MITFNKYIEWLVHFRDTNEGVGELPVFAASVDEGNDYQAVSYEPGVIVFEDVNERHPEVVFTEKDDEEYIPNAVIIN
jgi:hypothetical protein